MVILNRDHDTVSTLYLIFSICWTLYLYNFSSFYIPWPACPTPALACLLSSLLIHFYNVTLCYLPQFYSLFLPCLLINSTLSSRLIPSFFIKFSQLSSHFVSSKSPSTCPSKKWGNSAQFLSSLMHMIFHL